MASRPGFWQCLVMESRFFSRLDGVIPTSATLISASAAEQPLRLGGLISVILNGLAACVSITNTCAVADKLQISVARCNASEASHRTRRTVGSRLVYVSNFIATTCFTGRSRYRYQGPRLGALKGGPAKRLVKKILLDNPSYVVLTVLSSPSHGGTFYFNRL